MATDSSPDLVLSYADAAEAVRAQGAFLAAGEHLNVESVPLLDASGRVLASPVLADRDQPPFDRSTRDGFACRAAELNAGPLVVAGLIRAGEVWRGDLAAHQAIEIMTGAPVPVGADCVVMLEHLATEENHIALTGGRRLVPGENIVPAGSEAKRATSLLVAGTRLSAQHLAVAASCGQTHLNCFRKPRVAVQATGDELVDLAESPLPYQIRNSNSYSLAAQVRLCGGEPLVMPILRDSREATAAAILHMVADMSADLILLSGGVSMGRFDFVEETLKVLGAEFFFTGAKIQPGKPVVFGRLPSQNKNKWTYFFGLPGNPISTMVTFALFVHPLLNALAGDTSRVPRFGLAKLASTVGIKSGLTRFLPALMHAHEFTPRVETIAWQGSGDLASNARANCYVVVPSAREDGKSELSAGEIVSVLLIV
jgi:molybdopterin molybdotransferase